jgi:hypothetical protein
MDLVVVLKKVGWVGVCGFPPIRQEKGESMGHGALKWDAGLWWCLERPIRELWWCLRKTDPKVVVVLRKTDE